MDTRVNRFFFILFFMYINIFKLCYSYMYIEFFRHEVLLLLLLLLLLLFPYLSL
ncbi:MAG: hypothetical protein K7J15_06315 [Candidatus Regiella insecticola]|nr:hypothetical protein [Candidatus Regiella insecticola]